jgi:hypothetical protein
MTALQIMQAFLLQGEEICDGIKINAGI